MHINDSIARKIVNLTSLLPEVDMFDFLSDDEKKPYLDLAEKIIKIPKEADHYTSLISYLLYQHDLDHNNVCEISYISRNITFMGEGIIEYETYRNLVEKYNSMAYKIRGEITRIIDNAHPIITVPDKGNFDLLSEYGNWMYFSRGTEPFDYTYYIGWKPTNTK